MAVEYWILDKSQGFLARVHGTQQSATSSGIWQTLRHIEQTLGALIILGLDPTEEVLKPILRDAGMEQTKYGSLSRMIVLYAQEKNYARVAKCLSAPVPEIRRIFRPAIDVLVASKDLQAVAVGCYLRNLIHQASLGGSGLSKRCLARMRRIKRMHFTAPPLDASPLLCHGHIEKLGDTPWVMLEISSDHRMDKIRPALQSQMKKMFGANNAAQVFAPLDSNGELELGYVFARSTNLKLTRSFTRIRGFSELSARYDDNGEFLEAVTLPNETVQALITKSDLASPRNPKLGSFVQVMSGEMKGYCGRAIEKRATGVLVEVSFPSGRVFLIHCAPGSTKVLDVPASKQAFWGARS